MIARRKFRDLKEKKRLEKESRKKRQEYEHEEKERKHREKLELLKKKKVIDLAEQVSKYRSNCCDTINCKLHHQAPQSKITALEFLLIDFPYSQQQFLFSKNSTNNLPTWITVRWWTKCLIFSELMGWKVNQFRDRQLSG